VSERLPYVHVDRLIFDIPGLDEARARVLALRVADGLALAELSGPRASASVAVHAAATTPEEIVARIVSALMEQPA
jgi:hypothetical protein